jgi:hypothetical protein
VTILTYSERRKHWEWCQCYDPGCEATEAAAPGARALDWDFTAWCYASPYDASDPDARRMFDTPNAKAVRDCIDQPPRYTSSRRPRRR